MSQPSPRPLPERVTFLLGNLPIAADALEDEYPVAAAYMREAAAALTDLSARVEQAQRQLEASQAQRKGMEDFLSGQPKEFPKWADSAAKESSLNFAWTIGYELAQASDVFRLIVERADRTATRVRAAEARILELEATLQRRDGQ